MKVRDYTELENKKHGDEGFPLALYDVILEGNGSTIAAHWHKEIEVVLVLQGHFNLQVDTQMHDCKKNDILIINPEELHYFKNIKKENAILKTIVFDVAQLHCMLLDKATLYFIKPIINGKTKFCTILSANDKAYKSVYELINQLIEVYEEGFYGFQLEVKSCLFKFIATLYRYEKARDENRLDTSVNQVRKIKEIIEYISQNYMKQLTMVELAVLCHYNTEYFMKFFKKHTGMTCGQFIKAYRLEKAAWFIEHTEKPITQIALDVGFLNISYFTRSFKEYYNQTPKSFRNKIREMGKDKKETKAIYLCQ